eukprot:jgi/Ulvmu1/12193/UM085_0057.1
MKGRHRHTPTVSCQQNRRVASAAVAECTLKLHHAQYGIIRPWAWWHRKFRHRDVRQTCVHTGHGPAHENEPAECKVAKSEKFPDIPWDMQKVIEVMTLWMFLFFLVGGQTATMVPRMLGTESLRLATYGHALGYCICDLTNLLLTITVITQSVRPHRFWKMGLFDVKPTASAFLWVLASCLTFPMIDRLSHVSQMWFIAADGISSPLEQSITYGNAAANVLYFFVVSICTPIWEEAIFRGFLLSSLTKYMPAMAATAVSSLAFTVAHFSFQRSLYLAVLGFIFGYTFVRTRNLMTPILIHSLWNFYVFWKVAVYPSMMPAMAAFWQNVAGPAWQQMLTFWPA